MTDSHKTVLVLEDEHALRDIMMWALQNRDYDVLVAETAEEALPLVDKADLVLTNLRLPGMQGDQFIEKVRSTGNFTPVIVVTATPIDDPVKSKLEKLKIVDWVAKPFSTNDLMAKVQKAVGLSDVMTELPDQLARLKGFISRQTTRKNPPSEIRGAASLL